jgi:hypothetical protein
MKFRLGSRVPIHLARASACRVLFMGGAVPVVYGEGGGGQHGHRQHVQHGVAPRPLSATLMSCAADPDPGPGAFLTPGSTIRDGEKIRIRIRDANPG